MIIMLGLLFLGIPALIFLGIINAIVSGNRRKQVRSDRQLLKYTNPSAYKQMLADEEKESERRWIIAGVGVVTVAAIALFFWLDYVISQARETTDSNPLELPTPALTNAVPSQTPGVSTSTEDATPHATASVPATPASSPDETEALGPYATKEQIKRMAAAQRKTGPSLFSVDSFGVS